MQEVKMVDCHIIEPDNQAEYSIIWLHGLGADGYDFAPIVPELNLSEDYKIRFVFPHAPSIPVTINNNYVMPAWFDIYGLDKSSKEDAVGIKAASNIVKSLIQHEYEKGIDYSNIILAGFSQGGAAALYTGLKFEHKLAGIMGLSCYLPRFDQEFSCINNDTPIFLAHGLQDSVVLPEFGEFARDNLLAKNYKVEWRSYNMSHSVCAAEVLDIANFIRTVLV